MTNPSAPEGQFVKKVASRRRMGQLGSFRESQMRRQSMSIGATWLWMAGVVVLGFVATNVARAESWNALSDFSGSQSPSSVWQYGWADGAGYVVYHPFAYYAGTQWQPSGSAQYPDINLTSGLLTLAANTDTNVDQAAVLRWMVPNGVTSIYVDTTFTGYYPNTTLPGNTTHGGALVRLDGTPLWSANVDGNASASYAATISVTAGQVLDFVWTSGHDGTSDSDRAALAAEITSTAVPLPVAAWSGLVLMGGLAMRRFRSSRHLIA